LLTKDQKGDAKECSWMQTPIELFNPDVWSPIGSRNNRTLSSLFNYGNYQPDSSLRNLFNVLYTDRERETSLDMGFRGRPAIGSAVMSKLDLDQNALEHEPWLTLFSQIKADVGAAGRDTRIFLCGSAFGGTGASGFPTIGRLIANQLKKEGFRKNVKLGGALLLPYFEFSVPPDFNAGDEIYARPEQFLLNTEAALRYYRTQAGGTFDTIYLLGNQDLSPVKKFSLGRGEQRNEPHFIELYAALAVQHFLSHIPTQAGEAVVISRGDPRRITWEDIPGSDVRQKMANSTRFAFAWTTDIVNTLRQAQQAFEQFPTVAPWSIEFFKHRQGRSDLPEFQQEFNKISVITTWCESYLRWLGNLHTSTGTSLQVQLFNRDAFLDGNGQLSTNSANFFKLVSGDSAMANEDDTIPRLKEQLIKSGSSVIKSPNEGVVGLARALYVLSNL